MLGRPLLTLCHVRLIAIGTLGDHMTYNSVIDAKNAIEFREQGTTPIQLDALDIAKGGVDKAVIGYMETFVVRPESLVLIGTKP